MSLPKVLVAGATGYLGKHVIRALHARGYPVRALARSPDRLGDVRALCADVVVGEATKPETLGDLVGDAKIVFSSLGKHDLKRKPTVWQVDHRANLNILERAKAGGIEHFVFVSAIHGDRLRHKGIATAMAREAVVDAIKASGIAWTILRPTGFFNDMADYFNMAARGTAWVIGDGKARINPIHGADLADFAVEKIGAPAARGQSFDVGGPDVLTNLEIVELAFAALSKPAKCRRMPAWALKAASPLIGLVNPFVADLLRAIAILSREGAEGPCHGTHRLADFFAALAREHHAAQPNPNVER